MSVYPRQPHPESRGRGAITDPAVEPERRGYSGWLLFGLLLLAVIVLCATGFLLARVLLRDSSPATLPPLVAGTALPLTTADVPTATLLPGSARITINPTQGYIDTLLTVTGQGWWPGEPVFIFLRSPTEAEGSGYAYAAAVADDQGSFQTALTFPNELRWLGQEWAEVLARGSRSELEANARFELVAPTPTNTVPPPTPLPTRTPTNTPPPTNTPWPTDTPAPTATPTPEVIITDWLGEYFANPGLAGNPALIRNDVAIDFNWGAGSPGSSVPVDQFSARWTRLQRFSKDLYRFTVRADDGVRFWIDGQLYVDEWHEATLTDYVFDLSLSKGRHTLQLDYFEGWGGAMVQLQWAPVEPLPPTATPTDTPPPTTRPLPDSWRGDYFDNPVLMGLPVLTQQEAEVNFNWGSGSPGEGIPSDGFSARWIGQQWIEAGTYRYSIVVDDGVRFLIDGWAAIEAWPSVPPGEVLVVDVPLAEGMHLFAVQYFEAFGEAYIRLWGEAIPGQ